MGVDKVDFHFSFFLIISISIEFQLDSFYSVYLHPPGYKTRTRQTDGHRPTAKTAKKVLS